MRTTLIALLALHAPLTAHAQDYAAEATKRMSLSFDMDTVEAMVDPAWQPPAASMAAPLPLEPNSTLERVTVYRHQAMVLRHRTEPLAAGAHVVVFEGLPLGITAEGLQASVTAGAARIVSVELQSGAGDEEGTARLDAVRAELEPLLEAVGEVRDRIESLLAQRAYLRGAVLGSGDRPRDALPAVKDTLAYVGDTETALARDLRAQTERAHELDEAIRPLLIKLSNPLATGVRVQVGVDVDAPSDVRIALEYQVSDAAWTPTYNARLDPDSGAVTLEYFGLITQTTGEDWTDARLLLSTARPTQAGALPELAPWFLGRGGWGGGLDAGGGYYDRGAAAGAPTGVMSASDQGNGTVVMEIPGLRTVAGDGSAQRVPVGTRSLPTTLTLVAVPKLAPDVYRRASATYDGDLPLLPGPVASHVAGDYVGSGRIGTVIPGEALELSFGTDDRFRVTRRLVTRQEEHLGARKQTGRYTMAFEITATNLTGRPQRVEVRDQVPVSERDDVEVKVLAVTPGTTDDPSVAPGVLVWPLDLAPGASRTVELSFSVTGPMEVAVSFMREMAAMH